MDIERFFSVKRYTSGGRIRMYGLMREIAERLGHSLLMAHIDLAMSHERYTLEQENRWEASSKRKFHVDEVRRWDMVADPLLASIRDINEAQVRGLPESHPLVAAAARIRACVYPSGVAAVTSLPFVEQVAAMESIMRKLAPLAADVEALGLTGRVAQLAEVTVSYREAVNQVPSLMPFAPVQEARDRGHRLFLEVLSLIFGSYYSGDNPAHVRARAELLAPVVELDRTHRLRRARRRSGKKNGDATPGSAEDGSPADEDSTSAPPSGSDESP